MLRLFFLALPLALSLAGCRFDPLASVGALEDGGERPDTAWWDAGHGQDANQGTDAYQDWDAHQEVDVHQILDAAVVLDGGNDGTQDSGLVDAGCGQGTQRCNADRLEVCDANGVWQLQRNCPVGCDPNRNGCRRVVPSNGLDSVVWQGTAGDVTIAGLVVIDTDDGSVGGPGALTGTFQSDSIQQASDCGGGQSKDIWVMRVRSLTVQDGGRLRFVGGRSVAILSMSRVDIAGVVDVSGGRSACPDDSSATNVTCAGPGGFEGGLGGGGPSPGGGPGAGQPGENGGRSGDEAGGGGAGHAAPGGKGGDATKPWSATGGTGGGAYGVAEVRPLCGGSGGGGGGPGSGVDDGDETSHAGGGGGAIQIVAQEAVSIDCSAGPCGVRATGGGGMGDHVSWYDDGGGGGGSGGAVLIEAPEVTIGGNGVVSVAGGAGGCGYDSEGTTDNGQDGPFGDGRAQHGSCDAPGGLGGGADELAGAPGDNAGDGGGGGGGAAGWIRINCYQHPGCLTQNGVLNPHLTTNAVSVGEVTVQ